MNYCAVNTVGEFQLNPCPHTNPIQHSHTPFLHKHLPVLMWSLSSKADHALRKTKGCVEKPCTFPWSWLWTSLWYAELLKGELRDDVPFDYYKEKVTHWTCIRRITGMSWKIINSECLTPKIFQKSISSIIQIKKKKEFKRHAWKINEL